MNERDQITTAVGCDSRSHRHCEVLPHPTAGQIPFCKSPEMAEVAAAVLHAHAMDAAPGPAAAPVTATDTDRHAPRDPAQPSYGPPLRGAAWAPAISQSSPPLPSMTSNPGSSAWTLSFSPLCRFDLLMREGWAPKRRRRVPPVLTDGNVGPRRGCGRRRDAG